MSYQVVGTCSICGGAVAVPMHWGGLYPPIPTCKSCGAIAEQPHGPVIPMKPRQRPPELDEAYRPYPPADWRPGKQWVEQAAERYMKTGKLK